MEGVYSPKDKSYDEEDEGSEQMHEAHELIRRKLTQIIQNAESLLVACKCQSEELTEPEVIESITLANDYIDTVHDYVMSEDSYEETGQNEEEPVGFVVAVEKAMNSNGRR